VVSSDVVPSSAHLAELAQPPSALRLSDTRQLRTVAPVPARAPRRRAEAAVGSPSCLFAAQTDRSSRWWRFGHARTQARAAAEATLAHPLKSFVPQAISRRGYATRGKEGDEHGSVRVVRGHSNATESGEAKTDAADKWATQIRTRDVLSSSDPGLKRTKARVPRAPRRVSFDKSRCEGLHSTIPL